ncbi:hypothetical protein RRG08_026198 [Elysia crispata]|uniref:Uncharacterized protein n=1 Tax=Elysia crispata TaxID=231223 RepID=A0AAE0ZAI1_9GAST|nr:hypothetical protein RRG08_026198 [Elysia crispata]
MTTAQRNGSKAQPCNVEIAGVLTYTTSRHFNGRTWPGFLQNFDTRRYLIILKRSDLCKTEDALPEHYGQEENLEIRN